MRSRGDLFAEALFAEGQQIADDTGEPTKLVRVSPALREARGAAYAFTRKGWPIEGRVIETFTPAKEAVA